MRPRSGKYKLRPGEEGYQAEVQRAYRARLKASKQTSTHTPDSSFLLSLDARIRALETLFQNFTFENNMQVAHPNPNVAPPVPGNGQPYTRKTVSVGSQPYSADINSQLLSEMKEIRKRIRAIEDKEGHVYQG